MNPRGLFITVEGGEGVGKSTNIAYIRQQLEAAGTELMVTREPGGTPLGEELRDVLLGVRDTGISAMAELLLIFAARAQHIEEVIEPALEAGKWVVCDRFTDATYAYQCGGRGLSFETVAVLEKLVQGDLLPDYTLLLDAPVDTGMSRVQGRESRIASSARSSPSSNGCAAPTTSWPRPAAAATGSSMPASHCPRCNSNCCRCATS